MFFLLDLAADLNLGVYAVYEQRDSRGVKAYKPRMTVVLLLYAYCVGLPSSRKIEKACWEDAAFRVLTGNQQPDHSRISDFRRVHHDALAGLFVQGLRLCQKDGLVSLGNVALDGTKTKANAFKHKVMGHERMLKAESQLEADMAALLRKAKLIDAQEDERYGKDKRGDELPQELQRRQERIEFPRKARAELEAETSTNHTRQRQQQAKEAEQQVAEAETTQADAKAKEKGARRARSARQRAQTARETATEKAAPAGRQAPELDAKTDPQAMPSRNLPIDATGNPRGNAQRNFTDPDSHILKGGDGWI